MPPPPATCWYHKLEKGGEVGCGSRERGGIWTMGSASLGRELDGSRYPLLWAVWFSGCCRAKERDRKAQGHRRATAKVLA